MTVMPDYLIRLGATAFAVGWLGPLWAIGTGVGAIAAGVVVAHRPRIATFTGWMHLAGSLPWLGLAAVAGAVSRGVLDPRHALVLSLALLFAFDLVIGCVLPVYFSLLARAFPDRGRGRWFGALFAISSLVGLCGPWLASQGFIREHADLADYRGVFLTAFGCFAAGALPAFFLVERAVAAEPKRSLASNLRHLWNAWRSHPVLRRYLLPRVWLGLGALTFGFLATYGRAEAGLNEHVVTTFGMLVVLSHAVMSTGFSACSTWLERRIRPARRLYLRAQWVAQTVSVAALLFAAFGPASTAMVVLAVAAGVRLSSEFVIEPNVLLESGTRAGRTDMLTIGAVVMMPATFILPLAAGRAIDLVGHRPVFAGAGLLAVPALVALWRLGEATGRPRTLPATLSVT